MKRIILFAVSLFITACAVAPIEKVTECHRRQLGEEVTLPEGANAADLPSLGYVCRDPDGTRFDQWADATDGTRRELVTRQGVRSIQPRQPKRLADLVRTNAFDPHEWRDDANRAHAYEGPDYYRKVAAVANQVAAACSSKTSGAGFAWLARVKAAGLAYSVTTGEQNPLAECFGKAIQQAALPAPPYPEEYERQGGYPIAYDIQGMRKAKP